MIKKFNDNDVNLNSSILSTTRNSGTVSIMDSVLIPANTLNSGDHIIISFNANLTSVGDAFGNYYLYWNTSGTTLTGAVQLGFYQTSTAITFARMDRHVIVNSSSSVYTLTPTINLSFDYGDALGGVDLISGINFTVDSYFIYAVGMTIPDKLFDSATSTGYKFTVEI